MSRSKPREHRIKNKNARRRWLAFLPIAGSVLLIIAAVAVAFAVQRGRTPGKAAAEVKGGPRLQVDKETVDLGRVDFGRMMGARFQLTNVGDDTLRFSKQPYIEVVEGC